MPHVLLLVRWHDQLADDAGCGGDILEEADNDKTEECLHLSLVIVPVSLIEISKITALPD